MNVALTPRTDVTPRCAICHDAVVEGPLQCPGCGTLVHAECRVAVPCPTLGCAHGAKSDRLPVVTQRASWSWPRPSPRARHALLVVALLVLVPGALANLLERVVAATAASDAAKVKADQRAILDAAEMFRLAQGRRAGSVDELVGPYLDAAPLDPWDNPYVLEGRRVLCTGPNGVRGGDDDAWMSR